MAAILDHIHMGCANVYTTAFDLTKTTRIGHYDGGFAGNITIGHKTMPLGGSAYIEIESIVDPFATADVAQAAVVVQARGRREVAHLQRRVPAREHRWTSCSEIASAMAAPSVPRSASARRPKGPQVKFWDAPYAAGTADPWETGKPTWCCWEDRLYMHPSGQPVINAPGLVRADGRRVDGDGRHQGADAGVAGPESRRPAHEVQRQVGRPLRDRRRAPTSAKWRFDVRRPPACSGDTRSCLFISITSAWRRRTSSAPRTRSRRKPDSATGPASGCARRRSTSCRWALPATSSRSPASSTSSRLRNMTERRQWLLDITETGDHFNGLCLGVDSMEELEVFARHWKSDDQPRRQPGSRRALPARQRLHPADGLDAGDQTLGLDAGTAQRLLLPGSHAALQRSAHARHPEPGAPHRSQVGGGRRHGRSRWRTGLAACTTWTCCR